VFFPQKFKQLNRCPIRFISYIHHPRFMINESDGKKEFTGVIIDIGNMLGDRLNFTATFIHFEESVGKLLQKLNNNEADLMVNVAHVRYVNELSITQTMYFDDLVLVVPPPILIGSMEKLLLPFTSTSWASIGAAVLLTCCITKLSRFIPKATYNYVFGSTARGSS